MEGRPRATLDTNVIVSGLIRPSGPPGAVLRALRDGRFRLVTSPAINEEILEVMGRPRLRERFSLDPALFDMAFILWEGADVVLAPSPVRVCSDPADDKFLAAAVGGGAEYLVSGDHEVLAVGSYQGVRVVQPEAFVRILAGRGGPPR